MFRKWLMKPLERNNIECKCRSVCFPGASVGFLRQASCTSGYTLLYLFWRAGSVCETGTEIEGQEYKACRRKDDEFIESVRVLFAIKNATPVGFFPLSPIRPDMET